MDDTKIIVWDTSRLHKFRSLSKNYLIGTHGIVLVYSITDKRSFENISYWISEIKDKSIGAEVVLVGNKCDLEDNREVSTQEG